MENHLKILLLEDSEGDAELIQIELKQGGIEFSALVVDTRADFINGLMDFKPDVILSDHSLPQFNSIEALKIFKDDLKIQKRSAPFILITGTVSEDFAVQCFKEGADDYILKDRMHQLPAAIVNALEKCRIENENQDTSSRNLLLLERYESATIATSEAAWDWDIENNSNYCGRGFQNVFGHAVGSGSENNNLNTAYISADDIERVVNGLEKAMEGSSNNWCDQYKYLKANGEFALVSDNAVIIRNNQGKAIRMIGAMKDITPKNRGELRYAAIGQLT